MARVPLKQQSICEHRRVQGSSDFWPWRAPGSQSRPPVQPVARFISLWLRKLCPGEKEKRRGTEVSRIRPSECQRGRITKNTMYCSPLHPGNRSKSLHILKRHYGNICFNVFCADSLWRAKERVLTRSASTSGSALMQKTWTISSETPAAEFARGLTAGAGQGLQMGTSRQEMHYTLSLISPFP